MQQEAKIVSLLQRNQALQTNVPVPPTPLLGREQAIQDVLQLLRRPDIRLLTLTGTAGIGKTRLSLEVATRLAEDFSNGIFFIPLAPISDPSLVIPTIAKVFALKETGQQSLFDLLTMYLQDKQLLLVLDNFEQVIQAAPQIANLLAAYPALKVIVTSREVLRIRHEQQFPVFPLALPDVKHLPDAESLAAYAAIALFVQRAQAIKPGFRITSANAQAIAEICAHLDGLPLAIELAAARIKLLSPQALLARLDHRLQVLTQGPRDLPERQQALRQTIQWSYDLLNAEEQWLFRCLSVFVGGCTLEAVEQVATTVGLGVTDVLNGITSLIDKSLVQQKERANGESRLMMLEMIREYGLEQLEANNKEEIIRGAHASYFLFIAEEGLALARKSGLLRIVTQGLRCLGHISLCEGDYQTALAFYQEEVMATKKLGYKLAIARALEGLAQVVAAQGQFVWAIHLWSAAERLREALRTPMSPALRATFEQVMTTARTQLGEKTVAAIWAQGRMMTPDQALAAKEATPKVDEAGAAESLPASPTSRKSELAITEDAAPTYPNGLTQREVEVLRLLTTGLSNTQIAEQLVISRRTVNAHLRSIYNKLDVTTRTAATRYAFDNHLV